MDEFREFLDVVRCDSNDGSVEYTRKDSLSVGVVGGDICFTNNLSGPGSYEFVFDFAEDLLCESVDTYLTTAFKVKDIGKWIIDNYCYGGFDASSHVFTAPRDDFDLIKKLRKDLQSTLDDLNKIEVDQE